MRGTLRCLYANRRIPASFAAVLYHLDKRKVLAQIELRR